MKKLKLDLTKETFNGVLGVTFERMLELSVLANDVIAEDKTRNKIVNTQVILDAFKPKNEAEVLAMGIALGRFFTLKELGMMEKSEIVKKKVGEAN